ncbi:MAG: exo-alpha-sialidase [Gemmatimonadota bacterium]|nr:exo-alpha-sialidase [Gemmatimonadota bacterium]
MGLRLLVGTVKGGFWVTSRDRVSWNVEGPFFAGWKVTAGLRMEDGRFLIGVASDIYGPALQVSSDLENWKQIEDGPAYSGAEGPKLRQIWKLAERHGSIYAGVQDAGLFVSRDGADTWEPVSGLNDHETRPGWVPGAGGLCAHALLFDERNADKMWVGISAVGVFRTDDGGATWSPKNEGVRTVLEDKTHKDIGRCVHGLTQDPENPDLIYRQDHSGMYRTTNGGDTWERNESGLPAAFGFPIVSDRASASLFVAPQQSDQFRIPVDNRLQIYRSTDGGDTWHGASKGLPESNSFGTVLRGAMAVDDMEPGGVYFGTTSGTLHASADLGESWTNLPASLPRVLHVSAWVD